jgi:hypothetical protein
MSRNDPADMTINIGLQTHLILENSPEIYDKNFSDLSSGTIFDTHTGKHDVGTVY